MMSSNEYLGPEQPSRGARARPRKPSTNGAPARAARGWPTARARTTSNWRTNWRRFSARKPATSRSPATWRACRASASLAQRKDVLIVDKSIHASLWDGVRLSGAEVERFTHEDMGSLRAAARPARPRPAEDHRRGRGLFDGRPPRVAAGDRGAGGGIPGVPRRGRLPRLRRARARRARRGGPFRPDRQGGPDLRQFFQIARQHGRVHRGGPGDHRISAQQQPADHFQRGHHARRRPRRRWRACA